MLIVDSHLDLAWNALQWNRDLLRPVHAIRAQEIDHPDPLYGHGTVALPEMRQGRIALCLATLLARSTGTPDPDLDFPSPAQAYGVAQGQLAYYRALERAGCVRFVTDAGQLARHIAEWKAWEGGPDPDANQAPPLGFVISMESADSILDPDRLQAWWEGGVRVIGPAHYGPGRYAGGTGTELGLTGMGERLLAEMERLGVVLDVTHFSDPAFWQALDAYGGPVLASHNNCRALVPHQRQFSDEQLRAIFQREGVIGVALDAWMLDPGWVKGQSTNEQVTLDTVVDHVDHICQLAGNGRHVGIGSDLDGGFGWPQSPSDLDTIADLQKLTGLLAGRGYSEADIAAVMHGNWLRFLGQNWGRSP
jgi:membrane dipeptidase